MKIQTDLATEPAIAAGQAEVCYRLIREDILHGRLAPGARLRIERLRDAYGASISTLRETLSRLSGEGLVMVEGHRGFAVAPVTQSEFRELASLRALLEEHALDRSFARGDLEWEGLLVGAHHKLGRLEVAMTAGERECAELWKHYDRAFHQALISACGSSALRDAHAAIFDRYLRYQIVAMIFRGAIAVDEHRALKEAALRRDAAEAKRVLRRHIDACVEQTVVSPALEGDGGHVGEVRHDTASAVSAVTVGEKVWARLRGDILAGRLAPRQKLRLDGLRSDYGVGLSTLREVLNRLATEGLVLAEGQRGFEVAPISREDLVEVAELRLLIESHALAASFQKGDVDWEARVVAAYHRLKALEDRMEAGDVSATDGWKRYDWEFHQALIAACGSPVLMRVHGTVFDKYLRYQRIALSFRRGVAGPEHKALLNYALTRDAAAAQQILAAHLDGGVKHALDSGRI